MSAPLTPVLMSHENLRVVGLLESINSELKAYLNSMAVSSSAKSSKSDWATLLCNSALCKNGSLDFNSPEVSGSIKVVNILPADVSSTTNKWNCAVIAQFLGSTCFLDEVKNFAKTKWNDFGLLEVQKLDNGLFIIRFQSEESKIKVLEEPLVFYGCKMMFLRPWVPNKPIQKLTLRTVPIWIKLPGLGFQYFSLQALSKLGSLVGRPLFVDKGTADQSRLAYARMCVEVKADEILPKEITFLNEFGVKIVQKVEYGWIPPRCTKCKIFGHNTADTDLCTRRNSIPDLKAKGDSHDTKSEQTGINADSVKVDPKSFCKDDERSQEKKSLLPEEKTIPRNKSCPCGSNKKYKACCESTREDEGGSQVKKSLLPEKKVHDLEPGTSGHTLTVKVMSSNLVINKAVTDSTSAVSLSTRPRPRVAECLVGDETGTIVFTARNEQVDLMKAGSTVLLHNAKINMFYGAMRLAVDKSGHVDVTEPANFAVKEDNNLSLTEFELVNVAEQ